MQSYDPRLFPKAVAAFQNARYDDAERDFKKILRGEPRHFGALNLYAILLMQTGRFGEAEPLLRKAVAVDSRSDASFYNFGLALKHLKKPTEALDAFSKSIALKPDNAESRNNRGTVFNDLGRYAEAIEDFDQALALNPSYAEAMSNRGRSLLLLERYDESAVAYDHALKISPHLPEAWMGRGTVQFQLKQWNDALKAFEAAIKLRGNFQEAWVAAGNSQLELHLPDDAVRSFEMAISLGQNNAAAWIGLANGLIALGRPKKALDACNTAIKLEPESQEILVAQGNLFAKLNEPDNALEIFDRVLQRAPHLVNALIGRGNVLKGQKKLPEALASYDRALALRPSCPEARVGRGNVFNDTRRFEEALQEYDWALEMNPKLAEAWLGRGLALTKQNEFDAANLAFRNALDLRRGFAEALTGYGFLMNVLERREDALAAYNNAIEVNPTLAEAWLGRGTVLNELKSHSDALSALAEALKIEPDLLFAKGELFHTKTMICDWSDQKAEWADLAADIEQEKPVVSPFPSLSLGTSARQQLVSAKIHMKKTYGDSAEPVWRKHAHERIRIAYFSADFREHAVAYLSIGMFELHDRARFETIALSIGGDDQSAMRRRMMSAFDRFIDCHGMPDQKVANLIREMEVDILVDMAGHTAGSRPGLLAARPAPIQVTYLGYPGTTGADFVDYVIADPTVIPPDQQQFYTEQVAYLPDCYLPNDRTRIIAPPPSRADVGLPPSGFVFCSFNQPYKITPAIFDVWMRLLATVPDSVLWLPAFSASARANLCKEAELRGVDSGRLLFAPRVDRQEDHLARLGLADLFLDTLNYNAHSTACDALWAGVPLISCIGSTFAGRVGASALKAAGLPELIVSSLDEYEALALRLATDPVLLASVKAKLVTQRPTAPLFDTERFTRNLEAIYQKMWQRAQAGESPSPLSL
ncbi:tetratricopeptide repeat protein [soil metagenome]